MSDLEERRRYGAREIRRDRGTSGGTGAIEPEDRGAPGYRVRIVYTEPEFQERNPHSPPEFSFGRLYSGAGSPQEAVKQAIDYFNFCAERSHVGWRRILKSVSVERG